MSCPALSSNQSHKPARLFAARWFAAWITAAIIGTTALLPAKVYAADTISVILDQAKVLQLPPNTATIILGNPIVADVTMINRNTQLILTGKSYGQTNMIALDAKGSSVGESLIVVKPPAHGIVVQRGLLKETYSCEPTCEPTIRLGDNPAFTTQTLGTVKSFAAGTGPRPKR